MIWFASWLSKMDTDYYAHHLHLWEYKDICENSGGKTYAAVERNYGNLSELHCFKDGGEEIKVPNPRDYY